jgi:GntR family transcriptional regulator
MTTVNSCDDPHALLQRSALVTHIRRTYYSHQGRPVVTADIVVPVAHCEIVHEIPVNRH